MENRFASFYEHRDESGAGNLEKIRENQKIIRRVAGTDKSRSFEAAPGSPFCDGRVYENRKLIGFGIHIFNEDVYPLKSFEIYLRGCGLIGAPDLSGCEDMVFVDLYHNALDGVTTGYLPAMRIFGVQDNRIAALDVTGMPAVQGIDAGMNRLRALDVSRNPELVELYVNDNDFTAVDLSHNPKLKYFYCHNNRLTCLDTTANPDLRHLNAMGNPLKSIRAWAPQRGGTLPLTLEAGEGGTVGLRFNPVYNAQWKETGEWQQSYDAVPDEGFAFEGWYENGEKVFAEPHVLDTYGASHTLEARFARA